MEKTRSGKVKQPTFPLRLEIPLTPRDSHFPHSPDHYQRVLKSRSSISYQKGDISIVG
jgi:hypothetical protein